MDKGMTMDAVLNPQRAADGGPTAPAPRKTEPVEVTELKRGDTVIISNSANVPAYRVVAESGPDKLNEGRWTVSFDPDRDTPGPGEWWHPGNGATGYGFYEDSVVERVTDLGDWEMCEASRLRNLDKLADGRGVWEVARQVSKDGQLLVRFAGSDNFEKLPLHTIVLVEGRRMNKHVQGGYEKSMKRRAAQY